MNTDGGAEAKLIKAESVQPSDVCARLFPGRHLQLVVAGISNGSFQQYPEICQRRRLRGEVVMIDAG